MAFLPKNSWKHRINFAARLLIFLILFNVSPLLARGEHGGGESDHDAKLNSNDARFETNDTRFESNYDGRFDKGQNLNRERKVYNNERNWNLESKDNLYYNVLPDAEFDYNYDDGN